MANAGGGHIAMVYAGRGQIAMANAGGGQTAMAKVGRGHIEGSVEQTWQSCIHHPKNHDYPCPQDPVSLDTWQLFIWDQKSMAIEFDQVSEGRQWVAPCSMCPPIISSPKNQM